MASATSPAVDAAVVCLIHSLAPRRLPPSLAGSFGNRRKRKHFQKTFSSPPLFPYATCRCPSNRPLSSQKVAESPGAESSNEKRADDTSCGDWDRDGTAHSLFRRRVDTDKDDGITIAEYTAWVPGSQGGGGFERCGDALGAIGSFVRSFAHHEPVHFANSELGGMWV